jgi:hypothetical protein
MAEWSRSVFTFARLAHTQAPHRSVCAGVLIVTTPLKTNDLGRRVDDGATTATVSRRSRQYLIVGFRSATLSDVDCRVDQPDI